MRSHLECRECSEIEAAFASPAIGRSMHLDIQVEKMWVSTWWTVVVSLFAHVFALIMGGVGGQIIIAQSSNFTSHTWCWWADCTWCWWAAAAVGRHASSLEA